MAVFTWAELAEANPVSFPPHRGLTGIISQPAGMTLWSTTIAGPDARQNVFWICRLLGDSSDIHRVMLELLATELIFFIRLPLRQPAARYMGEALHMIAIASDSAEHALAIHNALYFGINPIHHTRDFVAYMCTLSSNVSSTQFYAFHGRAGGRAVVFLAPGIH
eukprot:11199005-Karenia_brevis.AAC.4